MKSRVMARIEPKTATALAFSPDDLALISEAIRIAIPRLDAVALDTESLFPTSPLVERMRMYAESMADIRARIEA